MIKNQATSMCVKLEIHPPALNFIGVHSTITDVKWLTNIPINRLLSVCSQMVDCYIGTKRKKKSRKYHFCRMQAILPGKKKTYIGQQTDSKQLTDVLVHKRSRGQIYIRLLPKHRFDCLLSACCPSAVQNILWCKLPLVSRSILRILSTSWVSFSSSELRLGLAIASTTYTDTTIKTANFISENIRQKVSIVLTVSTSLGLPWPLPALHTKTALSQRQTSSLKT